MAELTIELICPICKWIEPVPPTEASQPFFCPTCECQLTRRPEESVSNQPEDWDDSSGG